MIEQGMHTSIIGRAIAGGYLSINAVNIRDYAFNKHQKVDDYPYGGGAGMLMQAEPVYLSYEAIKEKIGYRPRVVYLTPQGKVFHQEMRKSLPKKGIWYFFAAIMRVLMSVYWMKSLLTMYRSVIMY